MRPRSGKNVVILNLLMTSNGSLVLELGLGHNKPLTLNRNGQHYTEPELGRVSCI